MLEQKRVQELIEKFELSYGKQNGQEGIYIKDNTGLTEEIFNEIKKNKSELLAEIKVREEKYKAERKAKKDAEEKAEKETYLNGTKKFELILKDYGFPIYAISGVAADLLDEIGVAERVAYSSVLLVEGAEEVLGTTFTYQEVLDYITPIKNEKEKIEKDRLEVEKRRVAEIFATAKETGKKQLLKGWMDGCNDSKEECSFDYVELWAMPDGNKKTTRTHTW